MGQPCDLRNGAVPRIHWEGIAVGPGFGVLLSLHVVWVGALTPTYSDLASWCGWQE